VFPLAILLVFLVLGRGSSEACCARHHLIVPMGFSPR